MMFDYLEGFEKRMQYVAVTESIVNRKNTNNEIEGWFEKDRLDNLFFSLLVFIMEQTLNENDECTLDNIAKFLDDILPRYEVSRSFADITRLAEYMVKDILQNKGVARAYHAIDYEDGWQNITVRLIRDKVTEDNRIIYQLTDQGYDFLFRTKEVDKELDFKLEQIKLKELLRRKNYKHALRQSRDLIAMLRQKKREIEEFVYRIRQNIHSIDRGEHERLLNETYDLIDEEYKGMEELKQAVVRDEERIEKEMQELMNVEEPMRSALDNLNKIKRNLQTVITEQRNLIGQRFHMNDVYEDTIKNSFYASMVKRYDFEKEILAELEAVEEKDFSSLWMLMSPLFRPKPAKKLNLTLIYQNQTKLQESGDELIEAEDELLEEDWIQADISRRNHLNYEITKRLIRFAAETGQNFSLVHFFENLPSEQLPVYKEDKRLFLIMLKLYEIGEVDIIQWQSRNKEEVISEANGEFDLAWILFHIEAEQPDFWGLERLVIEAGDEMFTVEEDIPAGEEGIKTRTEMTNLHFKPVLYEEEKTDD